MELVDRRRSGADGERLYLEVTPDRLEWIPVAWTSLGPPDPWLDIAAGRCLFRVEDLLRLADQISVKSASAGRLSRKRARRSARGKPTQGITMDQASTQRSR